MNNVINVFINFLIINIIIIVIKKMYICIFFLLFLVFWLITHGKSLYKFVY